MSHELRTPLNGILGYTQILQRDPGLTGEQQQALLTIAASGEHLLTLINDILDLSKIEAGRMELSLAEFYLPGLLQSIVNIFQVRARQQGLIFHYEPAADLPVLVRGDERRLRQVLINLLSNAIKFTPQGRVSLRVDYHLQVIRFQVEDTGVGIRPEDLEVIFAPFRQVGYRSAAIEGTGLGLSISRRLVALMGGELRVDSLPGQGSMFWFDLALPAVGDQTGLNPAEAGPAVVGYAGPLRHILVVDDRAENRAVLLNMLAPLGFELSEAEDGPAAIATAQVLAPAAMLLDLVLPGLDGYAVARHIRQQPGGQAPVIIAISASAFEEDRQRSLEAGCNDFLAKPVRLDMLLPLLQRHLKLTWLYA